MLTSNNTQQRARVRVGLILTLIGLLSTATMLLSPAKRVSAQAGASWSYTGSTNTARISYTLTLLANGKVLVVGGYNLEGNHNVFFNSAEIYDPATGTWSFTGNLNASRYGHTATLLPNGKVLVVGGTTNQAGTTLNSAELYDPATETWSATANCNSFHVAHTATLLANGKVLVAGGFSNSLNSEIYDSTTGIWSNTGSLNVNRFQNTATLLPNGKVLVVAGINCDSDDDCVTLNSAELYDPASGIWSFTGSLNTAARFGHTATLLPNGKLLIAGGSNDNNNAQNTAELYDPAAGTWISTGNLNAPRSSHTATLLPNGKILVAAGRGDDLIKSSELYDPTTGAWSLTANSNSFHQVHIATLLLNGKVLIAGGGGDADPAGNTAELYDPGTSPNQIDDAQFFVRQHYLDFLNRQPDADGLAFWTNEITLCGADQQCINSKRINVSAAFFLSIEFQQTGYLVYRTYKASYGNFPNAPVPIKLNEFLPDTQQIGQGVIVNEAGWEQLLENNKQSFFSGFVQRSRFTSAYPTSSTSDQFVDQLFSNAGVTPSANDRAAAINEFGGAMTTSDVAARARALRRVAENSTLAQQEFNKAFVLMQYFGYLRRNPNDPPEPGLNFDGYNFWLTKLNQFNGNFINAEMVKAFLISTEYRQRFGQP